MENPRFAAALTFEAIAVQADCAGGRDAIALKGTEVVSNTAKVKTLITVDQKERKTWLFIFTQYQTL